MINVTDKKISKEDGYIGREGESNFREISIDVSPWLKTYPGCKFETIFQRPDGTISKREIEPTDSKVVWKPSAEDTQAGLGKLVVCMHVGNIVGKTIVISTTCDQSITYDAVTDEEPVFYGEIETSSCNIEVKENEATSFQVMLKSPPSTTQTVELTASDSEKISVSPSILTFSNEDWNVAKSVTVSVPAGSTESEQTIILSSTGVSDVKVAVSVKAISPFMEVNWLDTAYAVGQNSHLYNGWCPDTVAYDSTRNLIVFQQNHRNGNHGSAMVAKTLCTIDPYDPTVYTDVSAYPGMSSASEGVGGLIVENGVWTTYCKTQRRRSTDGGATWQTDAVVTPPERMYGVFKVNDVLYCGDDYSTTDTSHNGWYYVSYDDGLNWEQKVFDFADDYEIQCSEARFCQWKGKLYATLRREANTGLLARLDDSGWVVIYDQLPNVTSDSSLLAFDDLLAISSVDRPNQKLILSTWDGSALTVAKEYDFTGINRSGDFHTPTYIHGPDFQAVFFMTYGMYSSEYQSCMNAAVFGYKDGVEANTPTYEVETYTYSWQDVLSSPPSYNCTVDVSDNGVCIVCEDTSKPALGALSKRWPWCYPPDENGHAYIYSFIDAVTWPTYITDGRYGKVLCDTKQIGDRIYICVTKAMQNVVSSGVVPVKIMGIANKITLEDSDMTGAAYCGSFHSFLTDADNYRTTTGTAYGVVQ